MKVLEKIVVGCIRVYQATFSKWMGPCCRYYPCCSEYCVQAVRMHGVVAGIWMGMKRIGRCHPLRAGGVDMVPEAKSTS